MSWLSRNTTNSSSASYSLIDNQSLISSASSSHRPPSPSPPSPPPNTNYYNNNNNTNNNNNIRLTTMTSKGPAAEIQEQTTNLARLNGRLERMMAKMGTSADTPDFRDRMQSEQTSGSDLCKTAMIRLQKMANDKSSPQNNYFPRLAKDFEKEMIKFQNLLSEIEHKRDKIIENAHRRHSLSDNKSGSLSGREKLLRNNNMDDQIFSSNNNNNNNYNNNYTNNNYNNNNYANNNTSYSNQVALQQQQQQQEIDFEDSDIADLERRNLQIKALEGQMLEIAEMFHDMQKIVHEQQEVIDIIDNNISNAAIKVEEGHQQLLEAEQLQIKARKRKCAITFCLLILAGIIVLIVYFLAK